MGAEVGILNSRGPLVQNGPPPSHSRVALAPPAPDPLLFHGIRRDLVSRPGDQLNLWASHAASANTRPTLVDRTLARLPRQGREGRFDPCRAKEAEQRTVKMSAVRVPRRLGKRLRPGTRRSMFQNAFLSLRRRGPPSATAVKPKAFAHPSRSRGRNPCEWNRAR